MTHRAFYFGFLQQAGHFFQTPEGSYSLSARKYVPDFPEAWERLMDTGLLKNGKVSDKPDGRVFWTCAKGNWFAFYWWDRSGDTRGASNSAFYVCGPETAQDAFDFACKTWPQIIARQSFHLTLQP